MVFLASGACFTAACSFWVNWSIRCEMLETKCSHSDLLHEVLRHEKAMVYDSFSQNVVLYLDLLVLLIRLGFLAFLASFLSTCSVF